MAVLSVPRVLLERVRVPSATLLSPMVLAVSAAQPTAVLAPPVVLFVSAEKPVAVLELPLLVKGQSGSSDSGVLRAVGVEQQRCRADRGIRIRVV